MQSSLQALGMAFYRWGQRNPVGTIPHDVAKEGAGENRIPFTHLANSVPVYLTFLDLLQHSSKKEAAVLDLGCGTGRNISFVKDAAKKAYEFFGVDYSRACISFAQQQYKKHNITFVQHDGTRLPFPSNTFDFIVSSHVLEHIPKRAGAQYVEEIYRILKKGGIAVVGTPNRSYCQDLLIKNPFESKKYRLIIPHEHEYYFDEISKLFKTARRFSSVKVWGTTNQICRALMTKGAAALRPAASLFSKIKYAVYHEVRQIGFMQDVMAKFGSEVLIRSMKKDYKDLIAATKLHDTKVSEADNFIVILRK